MFKNTYFLQTTKGSFYAPRCKIHPQEFFVLFLLFKVHFKYILMLLLNVQVILRFVKISFQKLCFEFEIDGWDC